MKHRVTFDSNVWRIISSPDKFPNEKSIDDFTKIRQAIIDGSIIACLSETVFTLEGIKKQDRKEFLSSYKPKINISEEDQKNGTIKISMSIGPNTQHHPGNNRYLSSHLKDALEIGFKLLRCPRISGVVNPDIEEHYFLDDQLISIKERQDNFSKVGREIEQLNAGIKHIKNIGEKYDTTNWIDGIRISPDNEKGNIAKAIAEWADGDSVAAHTAYGNTLFCTRDIAKSGGNDSVLSPNNRKWLEENYNIEFVKPEDLACKIS